MELHEYIKSGKQLICSSGSHNIRDYLIYKAAIRGEVSDLVINPTTDDYKHIAQVATSLPKDNWKGFNFKGNTYA